MSGVTAASVIRAGLAAGQSVSEILDEVRAAVPGSRADASHVAYYRSKARRAAASELSARPAVPREWVESRPEDLDPALALTWSNLEQRRCLAEIVGWARVLEKLSPRVVDRHPDPEVGTLLEVELPTGDRFVRTVPQRFLLVKCGTGRTFALPVPREVQTALAANAWTYGLEAGEYAPEHRA